MNILQYGNKNADVVLIQPVDAHDIECMEEELAEISQRWDEAFSMQAVVIEDWNRQLSPWPAPPVFGREGFGGGAAEVLEAIRPLCEGNKTYILGGYSLAGLFALWAAQECDCFAAVAAASPSVWFPGFLDYMETHEMYAKHVYLSLGDREELAKNPTMATVGDCIRKGYALFGKKGIESVLEWNPGNHFKDSEVRMAKGFAWALQAVHPAQETP